MRIHENFLPFYNACCDEILVTQNSRLKIFFLGGQRPPEHSLNPPESQGGFGRLSQSFLHPGGRWSLIFQLKLMWYFSKIFFSCMSHNFWAIGKARLEKVAILQLSVSNVVRLIQTGQGKGPSTSEGRRWGFSCGQTDMLQTHSGFMVVCGSTWMSGALTVTRFQVFVVLDTGKFFCHWFFWLAEEKQLANNSHHQIAKIKAKQPQLNFVDTTSNICWCSCTHLGGLLAFLEMYLLLCLSLALYHLLYWLNCFHNSHDVCCLCSKYETRKSHLSEPDALRERCESQVERHILPSSGRRIKNHLLIAECLRPVGEWIIYTK